MILHILMESALSETALYWQDKACSKRELEVLGTASGLVVLRAAISVVENNATPKCKQRTEFFFFCFNLS